MDRLTVNGRHAGFTYIGLLIGVAIMGAMLAAIGPVWHTLVQRENEKALLFIGDQFRSALNRYYQSNQRYPTNLDFLVQDEGKLAVKRHLRKIFFDPMTNRSDWGMVKLPDGQIVGVYSLSEQEPLKTTGFRARDMGFKGKKKYSEWLFMAEGQGTTAIAPPNNPQPLLQNTAKF